MEVKPAYKQTEVGIIPKQWDVLPFEDLFNISAGGDVNLKLSSSEQDERHRFPIYSNALTNRGLYGYCSYADHPAHSITITARGTLGVATYRDHEYTAIGRVLVLEPKREIAGRFFANFINSRVKFAIESTGVPQLTAPQISRYRLAVPPSPEQHAIAEVLSDVDALLGGLDRLIDKKRDLKQAAMQQLLTGQTRLPGFACRTSSRNSSAFGEFPGDWELIPLSRISAFITKGSTPTTYGFPWVNSGVLFLRSECVSGRGLDLSESMFITPEAHRVLRRSEVKTGDILMTITGNVGRVVHLTNEFPPSNINQHIARIRVTDDRAVASFIFHFLSQPLVRKYYNQITTGQAYPQISLVQVRDTALPMPPVPEQTAIAQVLTDMDAELWALEQRREKTRALKQVMMQELLIGKTRLV
jgi:type I restriction enzyme S subunit